MNVLKRFLLSFMLMLTCTLVYAQTEITGTVVDETGETVIGATVMEKGTRDACQQWHGRHHEGGRTCP